MPDEARAGGAAPAALAVSMSRVGRRNMIDGLCAAIAVFNAADDAATAIRRPLAEELGIDPTLARALYEETIAEAASRDAGCLETPRVKDPGPHKKAPPRRPKWG